MRNGYIALHFLVNVAEDGTLSLDRCLAGPNSIKPRPLVLSPTNSSQLIWSFRNVVLALDFHQQARRHN